MRALKAPSVTTFVGLTPPVFGNMTNEKVPVALVAVSELVLRVGERAFG